MRVERKGPTHQSPVLTKPTPPAPRGMRVERRPTKHCRTTLWTGRPSGRTRWEDTPPIHDEVTLQVTLHRALTCGPACYTAPITARARRTPPDPRRRLHLALRRARHAPYRSCDTASRHIAQETVVRAGHTTQVHLIPSPVSGWSSQRPARTAGAPGRLSRTSLRQTASRAGSDRASTGMRRALACSATGMDSDSTPASYWASMRSVSRFRPKKSWREKVP